MAIGTRGSALAIVKETVEGVLEAPASGADFEALQDGFAIDPTFADLENAERLNSLGKAKSIRGIEEPSVSHSHYLRHSGVEGQAPGYGVLLEASLGVETANATERSTDAGSVVGNLVVTTGATDFPLGTPALIKDGTNGRSIRFSDGDSGTDVPLSFDLDNAPATGVALGKAVTYSPLNTGANPTVSVWQYIGNQTTAALEAMAGGRVTDVSFTIDAGELINGSYTIEGISYYWDPIETTATSNKIDWTDDGGTFAAAVDAKYYKDPYELATALETAMNALTAETVTVSYTGAQGTATGLYTIACTGAVFSILWKTGVSGSDNTDEDIGAVLGFSDAADDTAALTYTAATAQDWSAPFTPAFDDQDPNVAKSDELFIGDQQDNICIEASTVTVSIATPKTNIESICADSGVSGSITSEREVTISVVSLLENYEAESFKRFRENDTVKFQYNFGVKSGGQWQAGESGGLYSPTATITARSVTSEENLATLNLELKTFVNSDGDGEFFVGMV